MLGITACTSNMAPWYCGQVASVVFDEIEPGMFFACDTWYVIVG